MADVYSNQKTAWTGSFSSETAALSVEKSVELGIVQNVQITYSQQIARVYDVSNAGGGGKVPVYYIGGRTNGQITIARILGPSSKGLTDFYTKMGSVCTPQNLSFTFKAGCGGSTAGPLASGGTTTYTAEHAVMVNIGISVAAQDMVVNENVSLMFANLLVD